MINFYRIIIFLLLMTTAVRAEVTESDSGALSVFGIGCEDIKPEEQKTTTRLKATDKACFNAISSLPEIINIKDSFDDHDFNVMIYDIVDEYIEDMTVKTTKQDKDNICVEVAGYVTAENIGKAIDNTLQGYDAADKPVVIVEKKKPASEQNETPKEQDETTEIQTVVVSDIQPEPSNELLQLPSAQPTVQETHIIILSTIHVKPTEFYNHTRSSNHSGILKNILAQSDKIKIVEDENEANFVVTPRVMKAKIEPLNKETNRMQMVLALDVFDRNNNTTETRHQNKFALFGNNDDEQSVAKTLLSQMFEEGGSEIIRAAQKSSKKIYKKQMQNPDFLPEMTVTLR